MASEAPPPERHRRHVAILAFPFGSHPAALFSLSCAMAAAAPQCAFSFLSSPGSVSSLSQIPGRPGNLRLRCVEDGSPSAATDTLARIGMFLGAAPENLRKGVAAAAEEAGEEVACVVSDMFLWMAAEVAAEMAGVPWVAVWPGGTSGLMAHVHTEKLREVFGVVQGNAKHPRADESLDMVPGLAVVRVRDLPEGVVSDVDTPIARLLLRMVSSLPRAAAVVLNATEGLEPSLDAEFHSMFAKYLPVGPFNLLPRPLPHQQATAGGGDECLAWLDRQGTATTAYVSFGTIALLPSSELAELAHGLEASGAPFVWSLRDREALPAGFLERTAGRGLVVPWAPQARVLGHGAVGAFVTHCGWNSLMESVACGVPMICRPAFGDQAMAGRTVCGVWRIGFGFGGGAVTREELAAALDKLLGDEEEGREVRERCSELKHRAAWAVGPGGCSAENLTALLEIVCGSGGE